MTPRQRLAIWLHGKAIQLCPEIALAVDQIAEQRAAGIVQAHQANAQLAMHQAAVAAIAQRQ